jgi:hypothetical protein
VNDPSSVLDGAVVLCWAGVLPRRVGGGIPAADRIVTR